MKKNRKLGIVLIVVAILGLIFGQPFAFVEVLGIALSIAIMLLCILTFLIGCLLCI